MDMQNDDWKNAQENVHAAKQAYQEYVECRTKGQQLHTVIILRVQ